MKKLLITATSDYESDPLVIPVNSSEVLHFKSKLGVVSVEIFIKGFQGSKPHESNSKYNASDSTLIDGSKTSSRAVDNELPNLRVLIKFVPNQSIKGSELVFGNEVLSPIKNKVPVSLLSTGLKFFSWWVNPSIKGDLYADMPYLFGLALNSFTKIRIDGDDSAGRADIIATIDNEPENLATVTGDASIPDNNEQRQKYFSSTEKASNFVFVPKTSYTFQFDTNFVKMNDSQYKLSLPTYGDRTFDIDVGKYADHELNNFNWVLKRGGLDGAKEGEIGIIINFALSEEN